MARKWMSPLGDWWQAGRLAAAAGISLVLGLAAASPAWAQGGGGLWTSFGQNLGNTRHQAAENRISPATAGRLQTQWVFATEGDVSATPAVDGTKVYVPDWKGNLFAVDRRTGQKVWSVKIAAVTGMPLDKARATPVITGDKVIVGTQGGILAGGGLGARVIALDKNTGAVRWVTVADAHPAAIVTQSATVHDGRVYVGVASMEEALAGFIPGYVCCTFRGSLLALDVDTGAVLWKTYTVPAGYSGGAVWGSAPAVDVKRGQVYIATGNNYSVPETVEACVAAAGSDTAAVRACIAPDNYFDSIVALDAATGAVRWGTKALAADTWIAACIGFQVPGGAPCPPNAGPDHDFGQAPALFTARRADGKTIELVGAGQKSGQYWALDPTSGEVRWVTKAGPGGTGGGLQWGSAVDGQRVYTANSNSNFQPWTLPDGSTTFRGVWSALDAATGQVLWQRTTPNDNPGGWGDTSGPPTVANGVVFSCSVGSAGWMYALNAATGEVLWSFASGGSCLSGAAVSNGQVFWGSGYSNFGLGVPNNKLYAFTVR